MGHVLSNGLELIGTGTNIWKDKNLEQSIENMVKLVEKDPSITDRERKHAAAIQAWSQGYKVFYFRIWTAFVWFRTH
jgi:hypothetical protein